MQNTNYDLIISSSEVDIASKFYEKVIGLKMKNKSENEVLFRGIGYNICIKCLNENNLL